MREKNCKYDVLFRADIFCALTACLVGVFKIKTD